MLSSVIAVVSGLRLRLATQPYRRSCDGHPLWIAGLPTPDSWRSLRQARGLDRHDVPPRCLAASAFRNAAGFASE
jgi:hypothetical protein